MQMQALPWHLQIPSMAISTDLSSSSSSWIGLQCRIPFPVIKNGNPEGRVLMMGGGPRTFPGGVTKWQWKRMQDKKSKQLLKARLLRERQIYEMRKRAELKAAVAELEKPWEKHAKAPTLFAVTADEQLRALADRFQKPGGFDLWTDTDGPYSFRTVDGRPSARFFPKGAVHSTLPYSRVHSTDSGDARSSRSDTPLQAREYGEKPRDYGSKPLKNSRQGYSSSSSDNGVNLESNEGSGSREAHYFSGKRRGEVNGVNLGSNECSGTREAHYFGGKRRGEGDGVNLGSNKGSGPREAHYFSGNRRGEGNGVNLDSNEGSGSREARYFGGKRRGEGNGLNLGSNEGSGSREAHYFRGNRRGEGNGLNLGSNKGSGSREPHYFSGNRRGECNGVNLDSNEGSGSREAHYFSGKRRGEGNGVNLGSNKGSGSREAHYFRGNRRGEGNGVNLGSNEGSGSREAHYFSGNRRGEGNGVNLESDEGSGSREAYYLSGKRRGEGFDLAEDSDPPERGASSSDGRDSNPGRGSYLQNARNSENRRRGAAAGSSLRNGSRQRRGSVEEEVYGMESGNCSRPVRNRGIRAGAVGSNFINGRGQMGGSLEDEVRGMDLKSREGDYPQRTRDGARNRQIEAPVGAHLADELQGRDRSPFEKLYGADSDSVHGSSSSNAREFTEKPRRSGGRMSNFAGFEL